MAGKKIFIGSKIILAFLALVCSVGLYISARHLSLEDIATRLEAEMDATEKAVHLLARTTVIENGLRFGGSQMIEAVLNQCMQGESQLLALSVWDSVAGTFLSNTVSPAGLYVGMPPWLASVPAMPLDAKEEIRWIGFSLLSEPARQILILQLPVEHEEEKVGVLRAYIDPEALLAKVSADQVAGLTLNFTQAKPSSLSAQVSKTQPPMTLAMPPLSWMPGAMASALVSFAIVLFLFRWFEWVQERRLEREHARDALYQQALAVAHDIRSPVAALWSLQSRLGAFKEGDRELFSDALARIGNIAEDLLAKNRMRTRSPGFALVGHGVVRALQECRAAQSQRRPDLVLEVLSNKSDWSACVAHSPEEYRRILEIILQNAAEAATVPRPIIQVTWKTIGDHVEISVRHNGYIGQAKLDSNRLGVRYLREVLSLNPGAAMEIRDPLGRRWVETILRLERAHPLARFAQVVHLSLDRPIVVVDDELSVHKWFAAKFAHEDAEVYFAEGRKSLDGVIRLLKGRSPQFFVDFRLSPGEATGPELIQGLEEASEAYLITSTPEDPGVVLAAQRWNLTILSKSILEHLDFQAEGMRFNPIVLVDDDPLTRSSWMLSAKENGIELRVFSDVEAFLESLSSIDTGADIYVDGGLVLKTPSLLGQLEVMDRQRVFITTGDASRAGLVKNRVRGVIDKMPPWLGTELCIQSEPSVS